MRRPVAVRVVGPVQWIIIPALVTVAVTIVLATPVELFGLMGKLARERAARKRS